MVNNDFLKDRRSFCSPLYSSFFSSLALVSSLTLLSANPAVADSSSQLQGILSQPLSAVSVLPHSAGIPLEVKNRGWEYMFERFRAAGVSHQQLIKIFTDKRLPERESLVFSLAPKESKYNYRKLNTAQTRRSALSCYEEFKPYFEQAEVDYGVPPEIIVSILQVETACGKNTGRSPVLPKLLRLAAAADPENLRENISLREAERVKNAAAKVKSRAQWLEDTFLPHAIAVIDVAKYRGVDPFELEGSSAGAIGMPQFLPGHYLRYGKDADNSGKIDLFSGPDAVVAVARYLRDHGWNKKVLTRKEQYQAIWGYNHSEPYVETVLGMASSLKTSIKKLSKSTSLPPSHSSAVEMANRTGIKK